MEPNTPKNKRILIVDDLAINRELISFFVANICSNPLMASNGKECIEIVKKQPLDLILMDCNMPIMSGIEATRAIRALPQGNDIVIIGISGFEDEAEVKICRDIGMNHLCSKLTLTKKRLVNIIEQLLSKDQQTLSMEQRTLSSEVHPAQTDPACFSETETMNYTKALREFENDSELLNSLITDFNRIIHQQMSIMQQAFQNADLTIIQQEAHSIKGGAANLCAMPLSEAAKSLEMACRQKLDIDLIGHHLSTLSSSIDSFDRYVKA
jgi:CheY-like chemotaxis protein/HPt (histidine-containing phosphotransfer) domain-containing protein